MKVALITGITGQDRFPSWGLYKGKTSVGVGTKDFF